MFPSIGIHFPLVMDETADAEAEYGNESRGSYNSGKNIRRDKPTDEIADESGGQAEYGDGLIEVLLILIFENIGGTVFPQKPGGEADHRIVAENKAEQPGGQRNGQKPVKAGKPGQQHGQNNDGLVDPDERFWESPLTYRS